MGVAEEDFFFVVLVLTTGQRQKDCVTLYVTDYSTLYLSHHLLSKAECVLRRGATLCSDCEMEGVTPMSSGEPYYQNIPKIAVKVLVLKCMTSLLLHLQKSINRMRLLDFEMQTLQTA